jgi:hypothetical protein
LLELSFPAGMANFDGVASLDSWSASFSTGPPPLETEEPSCTCSSSETSAVDTALPLSLWVLCGAARRRRSWA